MTIPINYLAQSVRTMDQWRAYARVYRLRSPMAAARRYAKEHGKAIIFHADDSATIIERDDSKKCGAAVHRLKPDQVSWHSDGVQWQAGWNAYGKGLPCPDSFPRDYRKGWHAARAYYLESIAAPGDYIREGETLWNGARVSHCLAMAYNRLSDRIAAFEREGRRPPESLLNGRHKLIAQAI